MKAGRRKSDACWNALGFALLVNIVTIAILSFPGPLRAFENDPANVWVAHVPFVWLPTVLVLTALLGHVLLFRRIAALRGGGVELASRMR